MSNTSTAKSSGTGLCGATFLVFLVMRLTDHIDWAWYWVAAPLWMPVGLVLGVALVMLIVAGVAFGIAGIGEEIGRRRRLRRQYDAMKGRKP